MTHRRELDPDHDLYDWAAVELARWMKLKDVTQKDVGEIIRKDRTLVSKILAGESPLQEDHAEALDAAWNTGGVLRRIVGHAKSRHNAEWGEEYDALLAEAVQVRIWSLGWVPALLQTQDYARASFIAAKRTDLDQAVKRRMKRRERLTSPPRPIVRALIDEGALELPVGGVEMHVAQLDSLIGLSEQHTIRVVPRSAGPHVGRDGSFTIYTTADGRDHPYTATVGPGRLIKDPAEVATFRVSFDRISDKALNESGSIELLRSVREKFQ